MTRRESRQITVGGVKIGGGAPVSIQSMTNTDTRDAKATIEQIERLTDAGCEILRVAVPDMAAALSRSSLSARTAKSLSTIRSMMQSKPVSIRSFSLSAAISMMISLKSSENGWKKNLPEKE